MYVVNATELIPALQRHWRTVSFAALAADAGHLVGLSKEGNEMLHRDLTSEHGFSLTWPRYIMSAMGPRRDLDDINRKSVEIFARDRYQLKAIGAPIKTGL